MPVGKYYCDYCDKEFQDTPPARRRHLLGVQHQRARAFWYDSLKADPHGGFLFQPARGFAQGICHHFVRTGTCKYGDSCRYFHPKQSGVNPAQTVPGTNVADTIQPPNFLGNQQTASISWSGNIIGDAGVSWGNLPPSLRPPPEGGYPPLPFVDWG